MAIPDFNPYASGSFNPYDTGGDPYMNSPDIALRQLRWAVGNPYARGSRDFAKPLKQGSGDHYHAMLSQGRTGPGGAPFNGVGRNVGGRSYNRRSQGPTEVRQFERIAGGAIEKIGKGVTAGADLIITSRNASRSAAAAQTSLNNLQAVQQQAAAAAKPKGPRLTSPNPVNSPAKPPVTGPARPGPAMPAPFAGRGPGSPQPTFPSSGPVQGPAVPPSPPDWLERHMAGEGPVNNGPSAPATARRMGGPAPVPSARKPGRAPAANKEVEQLPTAGNKATGQLPGADRRAAELDDLKSLWGG